MFTFGSSSYRGDNIDYGLHVRYHFTTMIIVFSSVRTADINPRTRCSALSRTCVQCCDVRFPRLVFSNYLCACTYTVQCTGRCRRAQRETRAVLQTERASSPWVVFCDGPLCVGGWKHFFFLYFTNHRGVYKSYCCGYASQRWVPNIELPNFNTRFIVYITRLFILISQFD